MFGPLSAPEQDHIIPFGFGEQSGDLLDSQRQLEEKMAAMARRVYTEAYELCYFLELEAILVVIQILLTSQMDYCNAFYMELPFKTLQKL